MNRAPARLRRALAALAVVLPLAGSGPSLADAMPTDTLLL